MADLPYSDGMETVKRKTASRQLDAEIGERVHVMMWREGITLKAMASRIGVDPTGLGKKLKGRSGFAAQEIADLAAILDVSVAHLFGETKKASTPKGGGHTLPDLDSNQEPAGFKPGELIRVDFGSAA